MALGYFMVNNQMPVCHFCEASHFVAYEQYSGIMANASNNIIYAVFKFPVNITQWLVKHKNIVGRDDCPAEKCTLQLPSTESADR